MGDFRASINIKMTLVNKEYQQEWWINWSPDNDGVDKRIKEWFASCWDDAHHSYTERMEEATREFRAEMTEKTERKEYERLKKRFGQ